jgi:hypothetical protein
MGFCGSREYPNRWISERSDFREVHLFGHLGE